MGYMLVIQKYIIMGCGTSTQVHDVNSPTPINPKFPKQQKSPESTSATDPKYYLFGQTSGERKVVQFNAAKYSFTTLSSRIRIPRPKLRLEPIEILYQEAQEVILPDLMRREHSPPFNYMFGVLCRKEVIFLCGGLSYQGDNVYSQSYFYNLTPSSTLPNQSLSTTTPPPTTTKPYTKFQQTSSMLSKRYSHMGIYYCDESQKKQYVYIFGGKNSQHQPTQFCERFDFGTRKWQDIAMMTVGRAQGSCFMFMGNVYVFGGISNYKQYPQNIQVYNIKADNWNILNIRLHRGIRTCNLLSPNPNQILILGGISTTESQQSKLSSIIRVNLTEQTYKWQTNLPQKIANVKYVYQREEDKIVVFSNQNNLVYCYGLREKEWRTVGNGYRSYVPVGELKGFVGVGEAVQVKFQSGGQDAEEGKKKEAGELDGFFILGNENYPCILRIQPIPTKQTYRLKLHQLSMKLHLKSHMNIIHTPSGYFICGGCDINNRASINEAFLYDPTAPVSKSVRQLISMDQERNSAGIAYVDNWVYLFGGYRNKKMVVKSCEKYNIKQNKWQINYKSMIKPLTNLKTHILSTHPDKILLYGGQQQHSGFSTLFQLYDITTDDITSYSQFPVISEYRPSAIFIRTLSQSEVKELRIEEGEEMLEIAQFYSCRSSIQKQQIQGNYQSCRSVVEGKREGGIVDFKNLVMENLPQRLRNTGSHAEMESMKKKDKLKPQQKQQTKQPKTQIIKLKTQQIHIKPTPTLISNPNPTQPQNTSIPTIQSDQPPKLQLTQIETEFHPQNYKLIETPIHSPTNKNPKIQSILAQNMKQQQQRQEEREINYQTLPHQEEIQLELLPLYPDQNLESKKKKQEEIIQDKKEKKNQQEKEKEKEKIKEEQPSSQSLLTAEKNQGDVFMVHRNSMIKDYQIMKVMIYGQVGDQPPNPKSHKSTTLTTLHLLLHKTTQKLHLLNLPQTPQITLSQPISYTHSFTLGRPNTTTTAHHHYFVNLSHVETSNFVSVFRVREEDGDVQEIFVDAGEDIGKVGFCCGGFSVAGGYV